jgi:hypothetical protein
MVVNKSDSILRVSIVTASIFAVLVFITLGMNYYFIITSLVLATALFVFLFGKQGYLIGYLLWVMMFALGYRTIEITTNFKLHPLVVLALLLFVILLVRVGVLARQPVRLNLPRIVGLLSLFWLLSFYIGAMNDLPLDRMFAHVSDFLILIPIFAITSYLLEDGENWRPVIRTIFLAGALIAILGTLEFLFPEFRNTFRDFMTVDPTSIRGFVRARFSFFGNQNATFICALAVPLLIPLLRWHKRWWMRLLLMLAGAIMLYAIYIGGHRSLWVILFVAFLTIVLLSLRRTIYPVLLFGVGIVLVLSLVPIEGVERLLSLEGILANNTRDNSLLVRASRVDTALDQALESPLGMGWSAAGWVHNDFVQLWADTGWLSAALFTGWYVWTLLKIFARAWRHSDALDIGLGVSFLVAGALFLTQPIYVLPQLVIPVWTIWALVFQRIRYQEATETIHVADETQRAYPHLQQPAAPASLHRERELGG